jgi:hypothetical protein
MEEFKFMTAAALSEKQRPLPCCWAWFSGGFLDQEFQEQAKLHSVLASVGGQLSIFIASCEIPVMKPTCSDFQVRVMTGNGQGKLRGTSEQCSGIFTNF